MEIVIVGEITDECLFRMVLQGMVSVTMRRVEASIPFLASIESTLSALRLFQYSMLIFLKAPQMAPSEGASLTAIECLILVTPLGSSIARLEASLFSSSVSSRSPFIPKSINGLNRLMVIVATRLSVSFFLTSFML